MFRDDARDKLVAFTLCFGGLTAATGSPTGAAAISAVPALNDIVSRWRDRSDGDVRAVFKRLRRDIDRNWEKWSEIPSEADPGLKSRVIQSFEDVLPSCIPRKEDIVALKLDPEAVARFALERATKIQPDVYADANPKNREAHLARKFLLNLTSSAYWQLLEVPEFQTGLASLLWRELLTWQSRMEDKQDKQTAMLRELLARNAPGLPLDTAKAILLDFGHGEVPDDVAQIERLLRNAAAEYATFRERLQDLDNSGDLIVRDLSKEAEALVAEGQFDAADAKLIEAEHHGDLARAKIRANRGDLAKLRLRYREASEHYAEAARILPQEERQARWRYELLRAISLYDLGQDFGENAALEVAIQTFREDALPLAPRVEAHLDWAKTQNNLGAALQTLGERESGAARLEEAIVAYRAALEEYSRDRVPLDWAATQNNLGIALRSLGARESGTARLEEAVLAFRAALEERTRDRVPLDWATTQMNLGAALQTLGARESGTARLEEAVVAYRAALKERTRDRVPLDWAMTQNNLGIALQTLGERESGTARLEEAVVVYRAALEEFTRDRVPLDWATTQTNLGSALATLGGRESGTALLEEAVVAYRAALEERTRDRVPLNWASTQNNLGVALSVLGARESGTVRLEEAVVAYGAALEEWARDRVPLDWAATQNNLGNALSVLGARASGTARLEEAVVAYRAALEERTRDRVPLEWASTTGNQGAALRVLAERTQDLQMAQQALDQLQRAANGLRTGGHIPRTEEFEQKIPEAHALVEILFARLS
ncbi:MAG: tetratricopeptide repeat protein [Pseudomonadota bacterium]